MSLASTIIQTVVNTLQQDCGKIIYESKRTKAFNTEWLDKLKVDQLDQVADIAVIVTETMPPDMDRFGQKEGIWICNFQEIKSLTFALREMLVRTHSVKTAQENKGDKMEMILQKGTELGINSFSPVWSERSIPAATSGRETKKRQRWQRIVTEAARQSRRPILPCCDPPRPLEAVLDDCNAELKLMLWEEGSQPLSQILKTEPPRDVALLVGPEGGFSPQEAEMARSHGFLPVHLGARILRTETAGFAVSAVLQYLYGDLGTR